MDDKKPMPEATANEEVRDFIRDLVQADLARGQVQGIVTRFPPEPNGYLHLGHAKSICLNFGLSVEYGGRCHLRFDDTNPVKEEQEYIDAIKRDVHWLGFDWGEHLYHASDYFQTLYDWAEHLIRARPAEVRLYSTLFKRPDPGADGDLDTNLNPGSLEVLSGALLEPSLAEMPVGEAVQFERQGYFCPDPTSRSDALVFNRTIELRDTWAKLQVGG